MSTDPLPQPVPQGVDTPVIPQPERGPVTQVERIQSIDVNPTSYGDLTGLNFAVWLVSHVLADAKFMTIFSMLFGAGIVLMTSRREAATGRSAGVHYRRMGVLLGIALLHAYLLWYGDVLYTYAMCGFVVYLFRRCRPGVLLLVGGLSIALASAISILLFGMTMPYWPPEAVDNVLKFWAPTEEMVTHELAIFRGSWVGQLPERVGTSLFFQTFLFVTLISWRAGGVMLVGMALFKLEVFSAKRSSATYVVMIAIGVLVGIPIILWGVHRNFAVEWDIKYSFYFGSQFNYWASILVALGWVGAVMLVCKHGLIQGFVRALAATGQMAFTNYLMQTVICTTIFYGHGFALFGKVERVHQILVVLAVWVFQLIVSPLWLRRFRFGPMEWLWRSLTYRKAQPMRRG